MAKFRLSTLSETAHPNIGRHKPRTKIFNAFMDWFSVRSHDSTQFSPSRCPLVPGSIDAWIGIVVVSRVLIAAGVVWIFKPREADNLIGTLSYTTMVSGYRWEVIRCSDWISASIFIGPSKAPLPRNNIG